MDIIINERQENLIINQLLKENSVRELGPMRLGLMKFLDSMFKRASMPTMDEKGNPSTHELVVKVYNNNPLETMTDKDLFYYLQAHDKFRNALPSDERDDFLKKGIVAWYRKKINPKTGNIIP